VSLAEAVGDVQHREIRPARPDPTGTLPAFLSSRPPEKRRPMTTEPLLAPLAPVAPLAPASPAAPQALRTVTVGLAGWLLGAAFLLALLRWLDLEVGAFGGSARALSLALGFILGTATVLFYAAVTSLRRPSALAGMMAGVAVFLVPVLGALVAPTLFLDAVRIAALQDSGYSRWVLEATPLALLGLCALAAALPRREEPWWRRLRAELILLPLCLYVFLG
jgi:hypothetical protein